MKRTVIGIAALLLISGSALAGEQYVDKTGYAISGYDVVAYWDKPQAAVGKVQPKAVAGKASITAEYNGAKWAFSTPENRDKFLADPAKYVPQFDGHCAYGVALDGKVPGNPNLWRIVDDKLYLNITKTVVGFWEKDIPGFIKKGSKNWSKLEAKAAAKRKVPELDIGQAPK